MDSQVITGVAASAPYVSAGTTNASGNMEIAGAVSPAGMLTAGVPIRTDLVDIRRDGAGEEQYRGDAYAERKPAENRSEPEGETAKTVVITYNQQAHESVIKFLDGEGNIVSQSPPRMYLKTMESSSSRLNENPGTLLNKVA